MDWWWLGLHLVIGFPLGLLFANAGEWFIHKYWLHGLGKKRSSIWAFHWGDHHHMARKNNFRDPAYDEPLWIRRPNGSVRLRWNAHTKELLGLSASATLHLTMLAWTPGFSLANLYGIANYYLRHRRAHRDPEWAKAHLPWHYDHHMGPNQDANWCVTRPWFDRLVGTRQPVRAQEKQPKRPLDST